jgi:mevalonate kinase
MRYPAKLLLFGEYAIIRGAQALAMPYHACYGQWRFRGEQTQLDVRSNVLEDFIAYLERLSDEGSLPGGVDTAGLRADLAAGMHYASNIPIGYGLGSSGALCAAVYDVYARERIDRKADAEYSLLKRQLALMESFFHGASSGVDPLVSYVDAPLRLRDGGREAEIVALPMPSTGTKHRFFLFDTNLPRETGPLVSHFSRCCEDPSYAAQIDKVFIPVIHEAIQAWLAADWETLWVRWDQTSRFQYDFFSGMITAPEVAAFYWV